MASNDNRLVSTRIASVARSPVWSQQDLTLFFELYRDGPTIGSNRRLTHRTRFTAIEDFILDVRKNHSVANGYDDVDMTNDNDDRVLLMRNWLCYIVPSCVFRYRSSQYGQTSYFLCCFEGCAIPLSSQFAIIRHYREQHFEDMPIGIFGQIERHVCTACRVEFKRKQHLNQHMTTITHITRMAMLGKFYLLCSLYFI